MHSDSYPVKPTGPSQNFKNVVLVIAKAAEERIREALQFDGSMSLSRLEKQPGLKE